MKIIKLITKEELSIYMNPVRQQLLRLLDISTQPMTPKMLSDRIGISASGVQFHIKKLMSLGIVELDHTEVINGITASFYKSAFVTVQIGLDQNDELTTQKEVLMQESLAKIYEGYRSKIHEVLGKKKTENIDLYQIGDVMTGILHLDKDEAKELLTLISKYIEEHTSSGTNKSPWEYALILYNAAEENEK